MVSPNSPLQAFIQYEDSLLSQIQTLNTQIQAQTAQIDTLTASSTEKDAQIQTLTQKLQDAENALSVLQDQINEQLREVKVQRVIGSAFTFDFENIPYKYGAEYENDKAFDCSAFTQIIYKIGAGVTLPRTSREQSNVGQDVDFDHILPGDELFYDFNHDGVISHVAMAIGNDQIIQTNTPATGINIQPVTWNKAAIVKIKRVIQ